MQISFHIEGGLAHFPGLTRETVIETETLEQADRHRLERLLELVAGEDRATLAAPAGAADSQTYVITVGDGTDVRQLMVSELAASEPARQLLGFLRSGL